MPCTGALRQKHGNWAAPSWPSTAPPNHMHLLVEVPATLAAALLVKQVKGASAHLANTLSRPDVFFKRQGSYGVFSVSPSETPMIVAYIRNQQQHHRTGTLVE